MFNLLHSRYESLFCIPDEKRSGNRLHLEVREDAERRPVLQGHTNMGRRRSRGASAPDTELVGSSSFGEDMATENDIPGGRSEVQGRQLHQDEDDMQGYTAARGGGAPRGWRERRRRRAVEIGRRAIEVGPPLRRG